MVPQDTILSLIEQAKQLDPEYSVQSSFIYLNNQALSENYKDNKGWKLHISVALEDIEKAFKLIAPILYTYFFQFKVIGVERYSFVLSEPTGYSYKDFFVMDCGESIRYTVHNQTELLDKASLGLDADVQLTPEHLERIQGALIKDAIEKKHIHPNCKSGFLAKHVPERLLNGAQFTVYLTENDEDVPFLDIAPLIEQINHLLVTNQIRPGDRPVSDAPIKATPYFSIRNSCFAGGGAVDHPCYIAADEIGNLYNPALRMNPYAHLIPEEKLYTGNIVAHCHAIISVIKNDEFTQNTLIIFSFLHHHLNLNTFNLFDEESGDLFFTQLALGDFSLIDSHGLWREGYKTDETCRTLQTMGIFMMFLQEDRYRLSEESLCFTNKCLTKELQTVFELIEQKKSLNRTKEPTIFFEEYYISTINYMNFEAISGDKKKYDKMPIQKKLSYILSAIKATPNYVQQMKDCQRDKWLGLEQLFKTIDHTDIPLELSQWFINELNTIDIPNNIAVQIILIFRYLNEGFINIPITPNLEKALLLLPLIEQNSNDEIKQVAANILKELKKDGLIDEQRNPRPYVINKYGKMVPEIAPASLPERLSIFQGASSAPASRYEPPDSPEARI